MNADVVSLDGRMDGLVQVGDQMVSIADLMPIFGEADEAGNAVLDWNGGSYTAMGSADQFAHLTIEAETDDALFGVKG